ncbi:MAG: indole-3-glycerol-phosphate synthase [Deltaproteobacteria bacterium]|jgi:indole-3-glycerol phosphate synthase|nr:indole-3-glycerol-phosphate synthase [Deltaproteobacteria bacterium]
MTAGYLQKFRAAKEAEIAALKENPPAGQIRTDKLDFLKSLRKGVREKGLAVIAEYKRASPSRGAINLTLTPQEAGAAFQEAQALSVLTEETYFQGHLDYIAQLASFGRPILRKDFIFHPLQVQATGQTRASAVLLIVRLTPEEKLLAELLELARHYRLAAVTEVLDEEDLLCARRAGAEIIQVNARNLDSLKMDSQKQIQLIRKFPPREKEFWIAASGAAGPGDLKRAREAGFGAVLAGSCLMEAPDPRQALAGLLAEY